MKKMTLLPWLLWAAILGGSIGLTLYASKTHADSPRIAKSTVDGDFVKLWQGPCESKTVIGIANPAVLPLLKKAMMRYEGKDYEACWAEHDGHAIVIDEAGDVTPIPLRAFRNEGI